MHIIYCCFGGAHSSPVAAAIHLGRLPVDRRPTYRELMALDLYDKSSNEGFGCLRQLGRDDAGHAVYVLGQGPSGQAVQRAVLSGLGLAEASERVEIRFVDTLSCVNWWMRIGGFLSRGLGLVRVGRPIVVYGTRQAFRQLVALVESVRRDTAPRMG
ncbi:MAG TPA: DUF3189 family protein [Limnochordia bacterium]|nr:DUF3189 family protein [Limnochordia bacterium]